MCIDEEDKSLRNVTVLPPESGNRDIPADEEGNFEDSGSFLTKVVGELEVYYNETGEAQGENEIDGPTSSTRSTTKDTTISAGTTNEDSEFDPDNEDYVAHLPKGEPEAGAPKN